MNEIKGFTFYRNYFELVDNLSHEDKLVMLEAIVDYVFKDIEPNLNGLNKAIWSNIVLPINKSKNNSLRSLKNGAPKGNQNASKKQTKNKPKTNQTDNQKQTNNISNFLFLFSNLNISNLKNKEYIYKLLQEYLELRIKNKYTLTETVVKRLINKLNEYGKNDAQKIEIITKAINGAWKDFYPFKETELKPNWFDEKIEAKEPSEENLKEIEKMLGEFK